MPDRYGNPTRNELLQRQYTEDYFVYLAPLGNIATAASVAVNIQIQADSDFEWIMATCFGYKHNETEPVADNTFLPLNVQITDSGSNRSLFSQPVPINSIAGNGKQPFILPVPRIFMSKSQIQVNATNFGAATFDFCSLAFIGRKIFDVTPR